MANETPISILKKGLTLLLAVVLLATCLCACKDVEQTPDPSITEPPVTTTEPPVTTTEPTTTTEATTTEPPIEPLSKYEEYYNQNNDFVGWLCIPELTSSSGRAYVNYPVVQTDNNSFYLDKDFDKKKSDAGWIYADYKVPITEKSHADNITFYGHSMKDGTFFRHLLDYKSSSKGLDLLNDAYVINFDTRWEENQYVIVSCFLIGIYDWQDEDEPLFEYFKCRVFENEEDFNYFYDNIMLRSYYLSDVECEYGDEFITLSTCAYDFENSRFVVVARKVRDGEDISAYKDTYVKNRNKHMPSILDD